jgi:hypothetical protein
MLRLRFSVALRLVARIMPTLVAMLRMMVKKQAA